MSETDQLSEILMKWAELFVRRSMHNFIRYSKEMGISMPHIGALFLIQQKGVCGVSHLGSEIGISSAGASQMLDRLVFLGLIVRNEDPNDRRNKQIALTDKGRVLLQEAMQARQDWIKALSEKMTAEQKQDVINSLGLLIEKASQLS